MIKLFIDLIIGFFFIEHLIKVSFLHCFQHACCAYFGISMEAGDDYR